MPRQYKPGLRTKRYKKCDKEVMKKAVEEYLAGNGSIKKIAAKYDLNRSVLYRHSRGVLKPQGGQRALSLETEEYIIQNLNLCADWGYLFDPLDLRHIIKMYLDRRCIVIDRFKNNLPGPDFIKNFLQRHKDIVSPRIYENVNKVRPNMSTEMANKYFDDLKKSIEGVPPSNIINYDENGLTDDPSLRKIIMKRGTKYPDRVVNHSKASASIMLAGTAEGFILPPYIVYNAPHLYNTWVSHGPKDARYNCSSSGWFDAITFEDWIQTIIIPYFADKPGRKILIGENYSSHLSIDSIKLCEEHNIGFCFIPKNSMHLTQPLDVAFFKMMKISWRQILLAWMKSDENHKAGVPKDCFPILIKNLTDEVEENGVMNLLEAFKQTGIYPFNPNEVSSRLPAQLCDSNRYKEEADDSVITLLNDVRYQTINIKEAKKKCKVEIIEGKSVAETSEEEYLVFEIVPDANVLLPIRGKGVGKKTKKVQKRRQENNKYII